MKREQILAWMKREAEEGYRNFSASLLPEVPKERILGVRLPKLRKLAAVIVKEGCQEYLAEEPGCLFEEVMLRGMVIGADGGSFEKTAGRIRDFLPYIDNWSVAVFAGVSAIGRNLYNPVRPGDDAAVLCQREIPEAGVGPVGAYEIRGILCADGRSLGRFHLLYSFSGRSDGVAGTLWPGRGCLEKGAAEDSGISSGISGREG